MQVAARCSQVGVSTEAQSPWAHMSARALGHALERLSEAVQPERMGVERCRLPSSKIQLMTIRSHVGTTAVLGLAQQPYLHSLLEHINLRVTSPRSIVTVQ